VVAKRSHASAACVLQKLEVVQGAPTAWEAGEDLFPAALLLVAMRKVYKRVLERKLVFGQLLEPDDDAVRGRSLVCAFVDQRRAGLLKLVVLEDAGIVGVLGAALDQHGVAGVEQLLCRGGRQAGAVLERLGLGAGVEGGQGHGGGWCRCRCRGRRESIARAAGEAAGRKLYTGGERRSECGELDCTEHSRQQ
jgi:hypothetical protein